MNFRLTFDRDSGSTSTLLVTAADDATVGQLDEALGLHGSTLARRVGSTTVPLGAATDRLRSTGLLDGDDLVEVAASDRGKPGTGARTAPQSTVVEVAVVVGPDTGRRFSLVPGTYDLGRGEQASLQVADDQVSRRQAELVVRPDGSVQITDLGSTNGTLVDGTKVTGPVTVQSTVRVAMGNSELEIRPSVTSDGPSVDLQPDGAGGLVISRNPSFRQLPEPVKLTMPNTPTESERRGLPWVGMLVPLVFAGVVFAWTKQPMFLLFALLSPITVGANLVVDRRSEKKRRSSLADSHVAKLAAVRADLESALTSERSWLTGAYPTGNEAAELAQRRTSRLWERSPDDHDFLGLRLGRGEVPASLRVEGAWTGAQPHLSDAPIAVELPRVGVLGVAGRRSERLAVARSLIAQLAALHSADEVRVHLVDPQGAEEDWGALRWLPHCWDARDRFLSVSRTPSEVQDVLARLSRELGEQAELGKHARSRRASVLILDSASTLRRRTDVADLLSAGPAAQVYAIALDDAAGLLPEECRAVAVVNGAQVDVQDRLAQTTLRGQSDVLDADALLRACRALAPVRRVSGQNAAGAIPSQLTLFDLVGRPTATSIAETWRRDARRGLAAPVGRSAEGDLTIDLVTAGPHALVGGTSGSGKSEMMQTWVGSMALQHDPSTLNFLFIEYKGLSAFRNLQRLPHQVGLVTNLSPELALRALDSLNAELRRRQELFVEAAVSDIADYQAAQDRGASLAVLPRLVIVLDEFAELKQALPDFVDGLIRVARIGRSLGVHLILATQQVGRAVSQDISGNAELRISLRAKEVEDSHAVIGTADAARIPQSIRGRAITKRGDLPLLEFQSAWSGAPAASDGRRSVTWEPWEWAAIESRYTTVMDTPVVTETELEVAVEAIGEAHAAAGLPAPHRVFTEPLPLMVPWEELDEQLHTEGLTDLVRLGGPVIGRRDDLRTQTQGAYALPLLRGHVSCIGSAQTGRTTLLRTTTAAWATALPPSMFSFHTIDGARGLTSLKAFPHLGTHASAEDDHVVRLLTLLATEVNRRLDWLTGLGFDDLVEYWARPGGDPVPWTLLVVDRFEELVSRIERGPGEAALDRILSHGHAAGITVLAAGDETLARNRWLNRFSVRLLLRNVGTVEPTAVGLPARTKLSDLPNGRARESADGTEVQIAVVGGSTVMSEQNDALRALAAALAERWGTDGSDAASAAVRIQELPDVVPAATLPHAASAEGLVLGLSGDEASAYELSTSDFPLLVAGPVGSGCTTTLALLISAWAGQGRSVLVCAPDGSPLLANPLPGVRALDHAAAASLAWAELLADPDTWVVVDGLERDDLPDALVDAITAQTPSERFAGATLAMRFVPEPLLKIGAKGTLLYLCPEEPWHVTSYGPNLDKSQCFTGPSGRGWHFRSTGAERVQVGSVDLDQT